MKYLIIILMMLVILVGCSTEATQTEIPSLTAVQSVDIKYDQVEKTYISIGEVVPNNQIEILATGEINSIIKSVGDSVATDEVIILLDNENVTANYLATESQLRTIRDNLRSQYTLAKEAFEKQEALYSSGIVTKQQFDQSENQMSNLYRQYLDAATSYNNQVKNLKDTVDARVLVSPIEGTVAAIYVNEGQTLSNQLAVSIIDQSSIYLKTSISSDLKRLLQVDDIVTIFIDGDHNQPQKGIISEINEIPDQQTKLFEVHIESKDNYDFIIGEYAEIEYVIDAYMTHMVPTNSVVRSNTESYVYLLENGQVNKIKVTTGLSKGEWIEVHEINEVKKVLIKGQNLVVDGENVQEIDEK